MCCFLVPATVAAATNVAAKAIKKNEKNSYEMTPFSTKLGWLSKLTWGGSALLAFEHIWHGELAPFFPYITAISDPKATSEMLSEMAVSGSAMTALLLGVWAIMLIVTYNIEKKALKAL